MSAATDAISTTADGFHTVSLSTNSLCHTFSIPLFLGLSVFKKALTTQILLPGTLSRTILQIEARYRAGYECHEIIQKTLLSVMLNTHLVHNVPTPYMCSVFCKKN